MILKAVSLFLVAMLVLGMFGRFRWPPERLKRRRQVRDAKKCRDCGGYILGDGPCPCRKRA